MNATRIARKAPSIAVVDGTLTTTSQAVAEFFGKRHDDVLKKVDALKADSPKEWYARNFAETSIEVDQPNGGTRQTKAYRITRDGFTLLAMGFTGKAALAWKIKYIEAFNKMEAHLAKKQQGTIEHKPQAALPKPDPITPDLRERINKRAWQLCGGHYEVYCNAMLNDVLVKAGHTTPENWQPIETMKDALETIESFAFMCEANANAARNRGRELAKLVGRDFDREVEKLLSPEQKPVSDRRRLTKSQAERRE